MSDPTSEAKRIFLEAIEAESPEERARFLDAACMAGSELRSRVEALLQAHDNAGRFLGGAATSAPTSEQSFAEGPGTAIGPYKLLEPIGEGGMGTVYRAEQTAPVKRTVALKVIKPGMDSRQVLARFDAERQALALMDHPNIARVLDAGATEQGRPYFVMELVKGVPITQFCDEGRLTPRQRLALFIPVCQAVQHAHQKGVIHRDLKPSNVLVGLSDGVPVPKVIDFGVAKATGAKLTEATLYTGLGSVVGTLEYMSPEQAEPNQLDIDTRSDIYSLGVLLYELLTGTTPLQHRRVREAAVLEVLRLIREEEPQRPSQRLSSTEELPSIAANRNVEPRRLSGLVQGDLDWIVMKALEKERRRRYETANDLATDLMRYLADQPVQACPPSARYRFRKFARRNRAALAALAVGVLTLVLALGGLVVNNWLVTREKQQKEAALEQALREKGRADTNLAAARRAVKEYLLRTSDNPLLKSGNFQSLRKELLESALPFYDGFVPQSREDSTLEAERGRAYQDLGTLRRELGDAEGALEELSRAESIFQQLAGMVPGERAYAHEVAGTLISRGVLQNEIGRFDQAEEAFRQALQILEPLGPEYRSTFAQATSNLGELFREMGRRDEAETTLRRAIALRESLLLESPTDLGLRGQLAQSWINLGALLHASPGADTAQQAFQKVIDLLDDEAVRSAPGNSALAIKLQQARAQALNNLGVIHREAGRFEEAESTTRQALSIKEALADRFSSIPQYRHELARSYHNLGALLGSLRRYDDAQSSYQKAIAIYERLAAEGDALPLYSVELAGTYSNLGRTLGDRGQAERSLPWLTKSVEMLESAHGKDPRVAKVRESLVVALWARAMTRAGLRQYSAAIEDWTRAIELDDGRYTNSLLLKRASTHLNLRDHQRAAIDAQAIADSRVAEIADMYRAACVYAVAAGMVAEDESVAESYSNGAITVLRRAIARGYDSVDRLMKDPDLDSLRSSKEFKRLVQELEARVVKPPSPE